MIDLVTAHSLFPIINSLRIIRYPSELFTNQDNRYFVNCLNRNLSIYRHNSLFIHKIQMHWQNSRHCIYNNI